MQKSIVYGFSIFYGELGMVDVSVLDLSKLTEPIKVLIEKAFGAGEGLFRPFQMKRIARAEAEAKMILALGDMDVEDERQKRAMVRFAFEEMRKQENLEAVIQKAIPDITEDAQPEKVDPDWVVNFFDKVKFVSDKEIQSLWAKVLAGEINVPGKFSKRTVNFLAEMDKRDAEMFIALGSFTISSGGEKIPIVFNVQKEIYTSNGVNFNVLKHLDDIGLISFDGFSGLSLKVTNQKNRFSYFEDFFIVDSRHFDTLEIGLAAFSKIGQELINIPTIEPKSGFLDYLVSYWMRNYLVYSEYEKNF
jgi:hypothetical protein